MNIPNYYKFIKLVGSDCVDKKNIELVILLTVFIVCVCVFVYQYNNDVTTTLLVNESEVHENATFKGLLMDSYGSGVANVTITYNKPSNNTNDSLVELKTDDTGSFTIKAEYVHDKSADNSYSNFSFNGSGKYKPSKWDGRVTVKG
ncbi:MAG: hypothetical protein BZ136_01520 [Methanosphaera sp. rholeuAM74]|nr:MAG: hypothetical protein BZ136_01520 [Methanosphaera sp. rholeuAM74]